MTEVLLVIMVIYVTMVYGPIAAFLVELFPTKIRYTSMSLPYHIGNGWFGGMLPLTATAMVAATGDIYYGLWYPIVVALMTLIIGASSFAKRRTATSVPTSTPQGIDAGSGDQPPSRITEGPPRAGLSLSCSVMQAQLPAVAQFERLQHVAVRGALHESDECRRHAGLEWAREARMAGDHTPRIRNSDPLQVAHDALVPQVHAPVFAGADVGREAAVHISDEQYGITVERGIADFGARLYIDRALPRRRHRE
jgi:hypothetical protein